MVSHILAAIDFSEHSEAVLRTAANLARAFVVRLTVLHVASPHPEFVGYHVGPQSVRDSRAEVLSAERHRIRQIVDHLAAQNLDGHGLLVSGITAQKILDESQRFRCDFLVMGSHGHGRMHELLMGSTAKEVIRSATCPVVLVPWKRVES